MRKKIIVIDDEEQLGKLIQSFLEPHDYQVVHFRDGISGLQAIHEQVPDLILMDLLLPRMHGFDICQAVKKEPQLQHIPIIIMTSVYKKVMDKIQDKRMGVNEFIEKPLDFPVLLEKIERLTGAGHKPKPGAALQPGALKSPKSGERTDTDVMKQHSEKVQQDYATLLPEKIEEMEELWAVIQKSKDNSKRLTHFRRLAHKLISSGGNCVFEEIIRNAQQLELYLDMVIMEGEETLAEKKEKIDGLMDNMRLHPLVMTEKQLRKMQL
ncbi:MAG TPA: response regulator [Candidatus Kapabacteria bacterium]|nr:response regulator [Candidatus Kapabacteria bacterium]